jgi:signal peptidase
VTLDARPRDGGPAPRPAPVAARWFAVVVRVLSRTILGAVVGLLVWAQLPALAPGWTATVVQSGSMQPALLPGDVLVYQPPRGRQPAVGQIVLAIDPTRPTGLLTHRVYQVLPNNDLVTKGDANPAPDSTPLRPSSVRGVARLRVPWVGLPVQLWRAGRHLGASFMALGLAVVVGLASRPLPGQPDGVASHQG